MSKSALLLQRIALSATLALATVQAQAAEDLTISFQGHPIRFTNRDRPYTADGAVMIALNPISRVIGARVNRNRSGDQLSILRGRDRIEYRLGDRSYVFNGAKIDATHASQGGNNRIFVAFDMVQTIAGGSLQLERSTSDQAAGNSGIYLKDRQLWFQPGESPISIHGAWLLSVNGTASYMGIHVNQSRDRRLTLTRFSDTIDYDLGSRGYRFNGQLRTLREASVTRSGVVYVPIELFKAFVGDDLTVRR